jgi:hypothetical protein
MISTRNLTHLPDIDNLRKLSKSLAMLDAIISPEWESRYYSFNSKWKPGEEMASMRNGSGDEYFLLFTAFGAILKGFAHESAMTPYRHRPAKLWDGLLDNVPKEFASFLTEPAFDMESTTFCIWRTYADKAWQCGKIDFPDKDDPDGSKDLLFILDGNPRTYVAWAKEYYEKKISVRAVRDIYAHRPLTSEVIARLNANLSLSELQEEIEEIGWPGTSD